MRVTRGLLALTALLLVSCAHQAPRALDGSAVQDLQSIRNLKVYFGHQSVGANILEGLRAIEKESGTGPIVTDSLIGVNGEPIGKCEDFSRRIAAMTELPDVALMKFCYIDFDQGTDAAKLFSRYAATLDGLQAKYPSVTFVPVTTPLTTMSPAWKRMIKRVLGSTDAASAVNAKRAEFNQLLAQRYAGRTIFDVARAESTKPDGTRNEFEWNGETAYSMVDAYSSDGGHLNPFGERVLAEQFVHALAAAARARSARVSPAASGSDSTSR